ncbi:J domain-containing protein [Rufibacter roseus]|uniref:J domain-containing protein n=1 Tax=Rufibacter roseus TaxID=1567108 RepID=A0ABW2DHU8_9BACT|nr:J domain-containing protein [Rufibacter roseus]
MLAESYQVLQVPFGADMAQIRQAYRKLVLQYHPDRNQQPGAHDMFLRVQAAYEYLQKYQTLGTAPPVAYTAATPTKTQEELDWEKYQYVYHPPTNPKDYEAWARVAIKRARLQAEKDHAAYIKRTLAFQQKWWYNLARAASYLTLLFGVSVGIGFLLLPIYFWWAGYYRLILLGLVLSPIGLRILSMMRDMRKDIRETFGEDLERVQK